MNRTTNREKLDRILVEYEHRPFVKLVAKLHPRRILEVGVDKGWGAERMVKAANAKEYYGFDLRMRCIQSKLRKLGVEKIRLFEGDSRVTLPRAVLSLPKMNLIYIDGGKKEAKDDLKNIRPLIRPNTTIIIDDYLDRHIKETVNGIKNCRIEIMYSRRFWLFRAPQRTAKAVITPTKRYIYN